MGMDGNGWIHWWMNGWKNQRKANRTEVEWEWKLKTQTLSQSNHLYKSLAYKICNLSRGIHTGHFYLLCRYLPLSVLFISQTLNLSKSVEYWRSYNNLITSKGTRFYSAAVFGIWLYNTTANEIFLFYMLYMHVINTVYLNTYPDLCSILQIFYRATSLTLR